MKLTITQQFQQFILNLGISIEDILRRADIPNSLWKEELIVTPIEYYRMLKEFDQLISDEQILAFSEIKNINMFMPPFFASLSAKNGLEAIQRLATYKKLVRPISIDIQILDDTVSIHFSFVYPQQELPRFALLNEQLLLISLLRTGSGKKINPLVINGPFEYGSLIESYIGIPSVKAKENQIIFKLEDLTQAFLTQNNSMWQYLEPEFKNKLKILSNKRTFSSIVQSTLLNAIPSGNFSLEEVSKSLVISPRTLQRNLNAENTTFNQQLQYIQKMLAINYILDNTLNTIDIAYLVGYSDSSSFSRAFKKWTGKTISKYRSENNHNS